MTNKLNDSNAIQFENPFFSSFEDVYFRLTEDNTPVAVTNLGKGFEAVVSIENIRKQYDIKPGSHDDLMLTKVEQSLLYYTAVRVGDELPSEITCGKPSWTPKDRHFLIAKHRLSLQLVTWMTGSENIFSSVDQLLMMAEDPQTKKNIALAFSDAAVALGLEKDNRAEIVSKIELLAKELAYIEAMRDIFGDIIKINEKVQGFRVIYSADQNLNDTVDQLARLSQRCVDHYTAQFEDIDAQTSEVMAMLKNIGNQISYIHKICDDLYKRLHPWGQSILKWKTVYVVKSNDNLPVIRELYRFLAPRYMVIKEWVLVGKLGQDKGKPIGGTMSW